MNFSKGKISIEEAKEMDMVSYLSSLGYEPVKIKEADHLIMGKESSDNFRSFLQTQLLCPLIKGEKYSTLLFFPFHPKGLSTSIFFISLP